MPRQLMLEAVVVGLLVGAVACSAQAPPMDTRSAADQPRTESSAPRAPQDVSTGTCSAADQQRAEARAARAMEALLEGDAERFVRLSRAADAALPPACRAAAARRQPAMFKCTREERKTTLSRYTEMMNAALSGDLQRYFVLVQDLENSLSPDCWIAVNRHQDSRVVEACSDRELDTMAAATRAVMRAMEQAISTGDFAPMIQIAQRATSDLSPECSASIVAFQQRMQQMPGPMPAASQMRMPSVMDHGGGTYSMSGVGACSPSGCVAF